MATKILKNMYIHLIRSMPQGDVITGRLVIEDIFACDTLEHWQYAIPAGFYRLRLTFSSRFQEILPILDGVLGYARDAHSGVSRTGIRIHAGNTIEHTKGCILVGDLSQGEKQQRLLSSRRRLNTLRDCLLNYTKMNPNEEMFIEITAPDPYPDADVDCPVELQQRTIDAYIAEQRYYEMFPEEFGGANDS